MALAAGLDVCKLGHRVADLVVTLPKRIADDNLLSLPPPLKFPRRAPGSSQSAWTDPRASTHRQTGGDRMMDIIASIHFIRPASLRLSPLAIAVWWRWLTDLATSW